jgi:hypothetical protein
MVPLIHILTQNDCVYNKNVIVSITDFLFQIFIVMVITDHWTSCVFWVVISPIAKINYTIRYTHLYHTSTIDDNANPDPEQEVEICNPFKMEDA